MNKALIVVDVQNDFVEGGALGIDGGRDVAHRIFSDLDWGDYRAYIATKDWHINPGTHFEEWPVHCVADTNGAELCAPLRDGDFDFIAHKGMYDHGYSGFDDSQLEAFLEQHHIEELDIVGIAGDYCVRATALDAVDYGYKVRVLSEFVVSVDGLPEEELINEGIIVV